jgi:hypothetical protein
VASTLALAAVLAPVQLATAKEVWTDPKAADLPKDFQIQGEYEGSVEGGDKLGVQIIALGNGAFEAVVHPGGLPGAGWNGTEKILMDGKLEGDSVTFKPAEGSKKYLAQPPEQFSATKDFPPKGQKPWTGTLSGDSLTGKTDGGKAFTAKKTARTSPTAGKKPAEGAEVLFDGKDATQWEGGRADEATGALNTDGKDLKTKKKYGNYTLHLEFMLPYRPDARGQGRGNSGVYQVGQYETQVLDSFGLDGMDNECGGIYQKARPKLNMCLPPLSWQTYDIEFTKAETDASGKKTKPAILSVRHNGVPIHENLELTGPTGGARNEPEGTPGAIVLQGHGNPLQYRNIWIVEKK